MSRNHRRKLAAYPQVVNVRCENGTHTIIAFDDGRLKLVNHPHWKEELENSALFRQLDGSCSKCLEVFVAWRYWWPADYQNVIDRQNAAANKYINIEQKLAGRPSLKYLLPKELVQLKTFLHAKRKLRRQLRPEPVAKASSEYNAEDIRDRTMNIVKSITKRCGYPKSTHISVIHTKSDESYITKNYKDSVALYCNPQSWLRVAREVGNFMIEGNLVVSLKRIYNGTCVWILTYNESIREFELMEYFLK